MKSPGSTGATVVRALAFALVATRASLVAAEPVAEMPARAWIDPQDSIVILESPQFYFAWEQTRCPMTTDIGQCAVTALKAKYPRQRIISQVDFVKVAFPDLPPEAAPISQESIRLLINNDTLKHRIAPLNIRYIIYAGAWEDVRTLYNFIGGLGGYPGGVVIVGGAKWEKQSHYSMSILDLRTLQTLASTGSAEGVSCYAMIFPFIVGSAAQTESRICTQLGEQVLMTLETGKAPNPGTKP